MSNNTQKISLSNSARRVESRGRFTFDSALCCEHSFDKTISASQSGETKTTVKACTKCSAQVTYEASPEGVKLVEYDATIGKNIRDIQ